MNVILLANCSPFAEKLLLEKKQQFQEKQEKEREQK